jgi:hypothetical protein
MGWSGGNYSKGNAGTGGWAGDASLGIGIEAGRHDTQDNDFATGINQCINKDGSNSMTGPFNAGGQNVINAAKVAIGTNTPTELLTIVAPASGSGGISLRGNGTTSANEFFIASSTDGATTYLYNRANGPMVFATNNLERIRIKNDGLVGIGNATPTVLLDSARSANDTLTRIRIQNANAGSSAQTHIDIGNDQSASAAGMVLNSSTNTANAGANSLNIYNGLSATIRVQAGGSGGVDLASGATSWAAVSDERLKKNIEPLTYGLAEIMQIAPVRFDYKNDSSDESKRIGFIAQNVLNVIPEAVSGTESTFYGLSATELIPALVNAVKQLSTKVETLEAQVETLQTQVAIG